MVSSKNWIRLQSQAMCSKSQSGSSISHIEFEQDIKVLAKNLRSLLKKDPNICRERSAKTNHLREKLAFTLQHGFPAFWFTPSLCLPSSSCSFSLSLCAQMGVKNEGTFSFLSLSVSHNSNRTSVLEAFAYMQIGECSTQSNAMDMKRLIRVKYSFLTLSLRVWQSEPLLWDVPSLRRK